MRRILDVDIPGKKRRERPKLLLKMRVREMYDSGGVERGQCNKQGRMEEKAN